MAALTLAAVWVFFFEYLPPAKRVHFYSDIEGYHYPLISYAFQSLREGRFPEWDPSIYCGISFVGNIQAGLFYPPLWLLFLANWNRGGVAFWTVEALLILHYWIAFFGGYLWLRAICLRAPPAALGAGVYAFGGFLLAEAQHLGAICGYAWFPVGMWGILQAGQSGDFRPLWKTALGSALCLLAGYPPTAAVFGVAALSYALCLGGWRLAARCLAALVLSLALAAVQLGPAMEAAHLKIREDVYGGGVPWRLSFFLQYFLPNFYDYSLRLQKFVETEQTYLYLGSPAILALGWLIAARRWRLSLPALALIAASLIMMANPFGVISWALYHIPVVQEVVREWNFLSAFSLAAALLTAVGLDDMLRRPAPFRSRWASAICLAAWLCWCLRQLLLWSQEGQGFAKGWATAGEAAIWTALLWGAWRIPQPRLATAVALLGAALEWKTYGTSRCFNALAGTAEAFFAKDRRNGGREFTGLPQPVYELLLRHPEYRLLIREGLHTTDLRHYGLATPEGFDPFLPAQYRTLVQPLAQFLTSRTFALDYQKPGVLEDFGIGFLLVYDQSSIRRQLIIDPRFRLLEPAASYYNVFEYKGAKPIYRFDKGVVHRIRWTPEHRSFRVRSESGGEFLLLEQNFPGWKAYIDGKETPIHRARIAFQGIHVPNGEHVIEFRFRSQALRAGAAMSLAALAVLIVVVRGSKRRV